MRINRNLVNRNLAVLALGLIAVLALDSSAQAGHVSGRPEKWAQPLEVEGAPNLHKIVEGLYRSAQPSVEGMRNLEKQLGIKTVVNLRALHSDGDELEGTGIEGVHIPIRTWRLKEKHVLSFLALSLDPARQPLLFHCWHGADRTGTMAAFYRMVVQGWSKQEAIDEMTRGDYNYHSVWSNLIEFIEEADISEYRRKLGLPEPKVDEAAKASRPEKGKGSNP